MNSDAYFALKKYQVEADSLSEFLEQYLMSAKNYDRNSEYMRSCIRAHQHDIDNTGCTFIDRLESVTGETVSYYPNSD